MDGWLHVTISHPLATITRFHPVARVLRVGPRIAIDGTVVSRSYTGGSFQLPPGPHQLEIWMSWLLFPHAHRATCRIEVSAGQTVSATYYAAARRGAPGRIELTGLPAARVHRE
jgi:hypothetical protein